ncbi:MAG: GNAT family N-acetyltransferase [Lachnospiraceae bacterium]|nr:GNAT family N-acetyltransferase [Lachnospiraceae bacterium]
MKYEAEEITLRDGRKLTIRSAEEKDAETMLEYIYKIAEETHYMIRYPEEVDDDLEDEKRIINENLNDDGSVFLTVFDKDRAVGNVCVYRNRNNYKLKHRCNFAIALFQEFCGAGLGGILIDRAVKQAKEMGFEQMELGAFADNERALALYKKMGFKEYGRLHKAFKLKDGRYIDEICMVKELN